MGEFSNNLSLLSETSLDNIEAVVTETKPDAVVIEVEFLAQPAVIRHIVRITAATQFLLILFNLIIVISPFL